MSHEMYFITGSHTWPSTYLADTPRAVFFSWNLKDYHHQGCPPVAWVTKFLGFLSPGKLVRREGPRARVLCRV